MFLVHVINDSGPFIQDWKQTSADVYQRAIKEALNQGFRPHDMKLSDEEILHEKWD